jgi:hypothetical protein
MPSPTGGKEKTVTYEEFKAAFTKAFNDCAKYTPAQIGWQINVDRMAELADDFPEYEARLDAELEAA